ncbi:Guanylate cyclase [Seminavis robusta]|uniref:Guanylate cyclase n=1 Tax=Seminavis robusta TaxID=568900 RepID=A0A9N8EM40_9STRA|nr:Guanylate cyclase [Seminavis robusta]|eukprot:Sro1519_g279340.1 Guanylate cyclase (380) ;mRNA; r:26242-27678
MESVNIGMFHSTSPGGITSHDHATAMFALLMSVAAGHLKEYEGDPMSQVFFPIFDSFTENRKPVAVMIAWVHWLSYFQDVLPSSMDGVLVVLGNSCTGNFTYEINGPEAVPLGAGDLHDPAYDSFRRSASFASVDSIADGTKYGIPLNSDHCLITMDIYPSSEFEESYQTSMPIYLTIAVAAIFVFTVVMFILYDRLVERRQALVLMKAEQSTAIVTSLFPEQVRDRLMEQQPSSGNNGKRTSSGFLDTFDGDQDDDVDMDPIADLFPHCTVLFADISGFTAWSSTRDPAQVFILLQTVYQAFDRVAKRRKVFKVETIGDSYVAVTGLPEPQAAHAVIMARFAEECNCKMNELMPRLESRLGPDTAEVSCTLEFASPQC